jgi:hypothetical protein
MKLGIITLLSAAGTPVANGAAGDTNHRIQWSEIPGDPNESDNESHAMSPSESFSASTFQIEFLKSGSGAPTLPGRGAGLKAHGPEATCSRGCSMVTTQYGW